MVLPFFPDCAGKKPSALRTADKREAFAGHLTIQWLVNYSVAPDGFHANFQRQTEPAKRILMGDTTMYSDQTGSWRGYRAAYKAA